ncbi:hypothetical protein [Mucilaginibacter sp.]|uniref:carboxypeptidase-like regulatory domain-containing protein n=1 Tax=Mucilaginibacter sp. TaxID=1882438 RepID=UPI00263290A1|nr:hypothetical protein [Mucilaginibacter sp.]MDB4923969.1 hypothetical protein [Mucilaginibacter sp.]
MKIQKLLVLCALLPLGFAHAQSAAQFDALLSNVKRYDKTYPREKVHLHFDKPYYALGDTVWFEGYVVNAANNIPSDRSRILHIELINSKDSVCKALQLPINVGFAAGDITLVDSLLQAGNYRIRAYTNWMRNFGAEYFFEKKFNVVNPFPAKDKTATINNHTINTKPVTGNLPPGYDIQFFPEGGELVNGIKSTVAFKAVGSNGYSINISGKLIDEQNNIVLDFKTNHAGIGSFSLTPVKGKSYTAIIQLPGGTTTNVALPKALESGYVITTDISNADSLTVSLLASPDLMNKEEMVLMPLSNGNPLFFYKTNFPDKRVNITAPRNKLPGGMLQFTLFNSKNEPVAERLVFNNYQKINLTLPEVKQVYPKRGKTELAVQATDAAGNPLTGSFSLAVTNADDIAEDEQMGTTIFSNLLLTSDIKGHIETPNYYFTKPSAEKNKELDNLLLTQGYRRFTWKDMANGTLPAITYQAEGDLTVSGTVTRLNGNPAVNMHVNLLPVQSGAGSIQDTVTDKQGHFIFRLPYNMTANRFIVQAKEKGLQVFTIKLDNYKSANITPLDNHQFADTIISNYAQAAARVFTAEGKNINFNKTRYLKEVVVKDYRPKNKLVNSHSDNLNGPGNADYVLTGKDVERCADLTCLTSMLPLAANNLRTLRGGLLLVIDGNAVGPADFGPRSLLVSMVAPSDVESIEFMKAGSAYANIYGLRGSGGVLLVTTRKGSDPSRIDTTTAKNRRQFNLPVYMAREFYSPKYDNPENMPKGVDLRTTVYWNPEIITDKTGKAKVEFYNNDVAGNYQIIIEGISAKGVLGRQVFNYKVE